MKSILDGVENCGLHKRTPYGVQDVSYGFFSVARHFGGITYNGDTYTYFPPTDELIRDDVLKWKKKQGKKSKSSGGLNAKPTSEATASFQ